MQVSEIAGIPLVGDPDIEFIEKLDRDARGGPVSPQVALTERSLLELLAADPGRYTGIFLNPKLGAFGGVALVSRIRILCPATPIFFLLDEGCPLSGPELSSVTIRDCLSKPLSLADLERELAGGKRFDPRAALALAEGESERLETELEASDEAFVPVRADAFLSSKETYFDVYVRLSPGRYVKILAAGDAMPAARLETYRGKGVASFYLRKKAQAAFMQYCENLARTVLAREPVRDEVRLSWAMNWGEGTAKFLQAGGFNDGAVSYAKRYAKVVTELVRGMQLDRLGPIRRHLQLNAEFDHSVTTMMIASLLAIPLKLESSYSAHVVGLSALLHDVGFDRLPAALRGREENTLTAEEWRDFRRHPLLGQDILAEAKGLDPLVLQAVAQHHERRSGKGYPFGLGPNSIHFVAEIIGVSEELARLIERRELAGEGGLAQAMEKRFSADFSHAVLNSLKVFLR